MNTPPTLSLYLHIPFCSLKCAYCDFNSYAGLEELVEPYDDALIQEIRLWAAAPDHASAPEAPRTLGGRRAPTVFFGGGTPSLLPLREVQRIMAALRDSFRIEPGAEVSLEANPGTAGLDYLRGLLACGVNRISFGVQSFHDDELQALDRIHSAADAELCYRWARQAGFERINLDLIYGLPQQPLSRWRETLERAIALGPDHLSLYALTVEEGTKLAYDVDRGRVPAPDPDAQAAMYEWAGERLARAGYRQYEISNWARPGLECRHNLAYWRDEEWLGLGAGAHSHLAATGGGATGEGRAASYRFANVYSPRRYMACVQETARAEAPAEAPPEAHPHELLRRMRQVAYVEALTPAEAMADAAILALRLNEGLDVAAWEQRFGVSFEETYGPVLAELGPAGLLERADGRLRLTPRGRLLANEVFVRLLRD